MPVGVLEGSSVGVASDIDVGVATGPIVGVSGVSVGSGVSVAVVVGVPVADGVSVNVGVGENSVAVGVISRVGTVVRVAGGVGTALLGAPGVRAKPENQGPVPSGRRPKEEPRLGAL